MFFAQFLSPARVKGGRTGEHHVTSGARTIGPILIPGFSDLFNNVAS